MREAEKDGRERSLFCTGLLGADDDDKDDKYYSHSDLIAIISTIRPRFLTYSCMTQSISGHDRPFIPAPLQIQVSCILVTSVGRDTHRVASNT